MGGGMVSLTVQVLLANWIQGEGGEGMSRCLFSFITGGLLIVEISGMLSTVLAFSIVFGELCAAVEAVNAKNFLCVLERELATPNCRSER